MNKKKLAKLTADAELWDTRQLGVSAKYTKVLSDEETKELQVFQNVVSLEPKRAVGVDLMDRR